MTKNKIYNRILISICLALILMCSIILTINDIKADEIAFADAESGVHDDIQKKCAEFTQSKVFSIDGEEKNITQYEQYLMDHFRYGSDMEDTYDEWISKIVPIELFSVKAEEFLYIGKEYGFFFDYDWDENEYLIYLILHDIDVETSGQIMRKITPLFYEKYLFEDGLNCLS